MTVFGRDDLLREAMSLYEGMDRLFRDSIGHPRTWGGGDTGPRMDVQEMDDAYELTMSLPGWKSENIDITIQQNTVTIRGEHTFDEQTDKGKTYHLRERHFASFRRSFTLPGSVDADRVQASYENGELTLTLPKSAATKPHHVPITERPRVGADLSGHGEPPQSVVEQSTAVDAQQG
jgi:HSP20 family protein